MTIDGFYSINNTLVVKQPLPKKQAHLWKVLFPYYMTIIHDRRHIFQTQTLTTFSSIRKEDVTYGHITGMNISVTAKSCSVSKQALPNDMGHKIISGAKCGRRRYDPIHRVCLQDRNL
jgi:hypothetical protein